MKKYLLNTTRSLGASIFTTALLIAPVVKAETLDFYAYNPAAEISTKISHTRKLIELNYMQPLLASGESLPILDLKLKLDNYQSKEINIGLVYRRNVNDKFILGAYTYFDHRNTGHDLSVSGITTGVEFLSKYVDARLNFYLPQNKRKKISHNSRQVLEIKDSSVYLFSGGHVYESSSKGYDVEIGTPLFGFSDDLNAKFGTKIYAAKYKFVAKNIKPINGTRFRITQNLLEYYCCQDSYNLHLTAETQVDKVRRRQNFVGIGLKVAFNDSNNRKKIKAGSLNHRMMDTLVRDVDIVTSSAPEGIKTQVLYSDMNHHYDSRRIEIDSSAEIISGGVSEAEARALLPEVFNATNIPITIGGVTVYIDDNGKAGKPVSNIVVLKNGNVIVVDKNTSSALDRKKVALRKMQAFVRFHVRPRFRIAARQAAAAQAQEAQARAAAAQAAAAQAAQAQAQAAAQAARRAAAVQAAVQEAQRRSAAANVQRIFRGHQGRVAAAVEQRVKAVIKLQNLARARVARAELSQLRTEAARIAQLRREEKEAQVQAFREQAAQVAAQRREEAAQRREEARQRRAFRVREAQARREAVERNRAALRAQAQQSAATKLQSLVRGRVEKKRFAAQQALATKFQAAARKLAAKSKFQKQKNGITKLQALVRGRVEKKRLTAQQAAVLLAQRVYRGHQGRVAAVQARREAAATTIHALVRGHEAKKRFAAQQALATKFQAAARKLAAKSKFQKQKNGITKLQALVRGRVEKKRLTAQQAAVLLAQRVYRGHQGRVAAVQARQEEAAVNVQRVFRGHAAQSKFKDDIKKIMTVQSLARKVIAQKKIATQQRAARMIQSLARKVAEKYVIKKKQAATRIQAEFRKYIAEAALKTKKERAMIDIAEVMNRFGVIDKYNEVIKKLILIKDAEATFQGVGFGRAYKQQLDVSPEKKGRVSPKKSASHDSPRGMRSPSRSPKAVRSASPSPQKLKITNTINLKGELGSLTTSINTFNEALSEVHREIGRVANKNLVGGDGFASALGATHSRVNNISQIISDSNKSLSPSAPLKDAITAAKLTAPFKNLQNALERLNLDIRQHSVSRAAAAPSRMAGGGAAAAEEE